MNNKGQMGLQALPSIAIIFLVVGLLFTIAIVVLTQIKDSDSIAGTCSYITGSDGSDYFSISDSGINTTVMGADQLWTGWDYFTPRLNFTRNVSEQFYGTNNGAYSYFSWKTPNNFSTTLQVMNGSNVVSSTNYSLRNLTATQWVLDWKDSRYNVTLLTVYFNRVFIKNVDDIVLTPSDIYLGATTSSFLVQSTPVAYGDDKTFQFTMVSPGQLGQFVNVSNWAVGWDYTNRTCAIGYNSKASDTIDATIDATAEIPTNWLGIIAIIVAASLVITIVVVSLVKSLGGGQFGRNGR